MRDFWGMSQVIITRKISFSAAHSLHAVSLSAEENKNIYGKCDHIHGHEYVLEVELQGTVDPVLGMFINMSEVKAILKKQVVDRYDHKFLNQDCEEFLTCVPTVENIALQIAELLKKTALKPYLRAVIVHETCSNSARVELK